MSPDDIIPTSPQAAASAGPEEVMEAFYEILVMAADDEVVGRRLARAKTTLQVHLTDAPGHAVTVYLDREPIQVERGAVGTPEVNLYMAAADVLRFWGGDFHLAIGIINGEVDYDGPVNKVLRVVPIARRMVERFSAVRDSRNIVRPEPQPQLDPYTKGDTAW